MDVAPNRRTAWRGWAGLAGGIVGCSGLPATAQHAITFQLRRGWHERRSVVRCPGPRRNCRGRVDFVANTDACVRGRSDPRGLRRQRDDGGTIRAARCLDDARNAYRAVLSALTRGVGVKVYGLILLAYLPPALAHVVSDPVFPGWTFDGWVVGPLLVAAAWYAAGWARVRSRARDGGSPLGAKWFVAGWLVLAGALLSPLHEAGERSFAAHMLEHELLMLVAAPLLVLSRPVGVALWALPHAGRLAAARLGHRRTVGTLWQTLTAPTRRHRPAGGGAMALARAGAVRRGPRKPRLAYRSAPHVPRHGVAVLVVRAACACPSVGTGGRLSIFHVTHQRRTGSADGVVAKPLVCRLRRPGDGRFWTAPR